MKRLEEEESNLESDAESSCKRDFITKINDDVAFAQMLAAEQEIGKCLLDNQTMFSKASKVSKRDVDGIKTAKLDL